MPGPEDEDRDDHGRWTSGGSASDIASLRYASAMSNDEQLKNAIYNVWRSDVESA